MGPTPLHRRAAYALALLPALAAPAGADDPNRLPPDPPAAAEGRGTGDAAFEPPATGAARLDVAPPPPYPDAVRRVIEEGRRACLGAGGAGLVTGPDFVRAEDLTGDGRADTVLDFRRARCIGAASPFEGTGGWRLVILVARYGGGLVRVFSDPVLDYDITDGPGARAGRFRLYGSRCGGVGPDLCFKRRRLDARPFAFDGS